MGRSKGNRNGGRPSFSATNGYGGGGGGGDKFTFTDIDDEPKFIELPDDFETDSGKVSKLAIKMCYQYRIVCNVV